MYEYTIMLDRTTKRPYVVEERPVDYPNVRMMNNPDQIVKMMISVYKVDERAEEHVFMLTMNTHLDITGVFMIGKGDVSSCICSVREMMQRALLAGATGIVMVHNHPSGDPTPSDLDKCLTKRVATVGAMLQVQLLDSVIIGDGTYVSLKATNPALLEPMEIPNEWIR